MTCSWQTLVAPFLVDMVSSVRVPISLSVNTPPSSCSSIKHL